MEKEYYQQIKSSKEYKNFPFFSKKKKMNKRAVSLMVSYVLIVVIGIALSIAVYAYLKYYLPSDQEKCSQDISLVVEQISCSDDKLSIVISNRGLFNVSGAYVRFGPEDTEVKEQIPENKGLELFTQPPNTGNIPLPPGGSKAFVNLDVSSIIDLSATTNYAVEVQPALYPDRVLISCPNIAKRAVICS